MVTIIWFLHRKAASIPLPNMSSLLLSYYDIIINTISRLIRCGTPLRFTVPNNTHIKFAPDCMERFHLRTNDTWHDWAHLTLTVGLSHIYVYMCKVKCFYRNSDFDLSVFWQFWTFFIWTFFPYFLDAFCSYIW